jgi:hypothetical protein
MNRQGEAPNPQAPNPKEAPNPKLEDTAGCAGNAGKWTIPFPHPGPLLGRGNTWQLIVTMQIPQTLGLFMNRRMNMPLLRSLGVIQGIWAAIDMAFLRSFANRFNVVMHVRSETA